MNDIALMLLAYESELHPPRTDYDAGFRSGLLKAARLVEEDPVNRALATKKCAPRADRVLDGYWQPGKSTLRAAS